MSNKRITTSVDAGATQYTLPGNTGDWKIDLNLVVDTVFGQTFESNQPSLGNGMITANGIFKGVAGYNVTIKKGGTAVTMAAEPCSLVSGKIYQITSAAHRVISYLDSLTVQDNSVDQTANVLTVDYLTGTVTFKPAYTPTGPITVTGKYIPLAVMAKAKSFSMTQTAAVSDGSCFDDAQSNGGFRTNYPSLKKISLNVSHIFAATNAWLTTVLARDIAYVEIDLDVSNPGINVARGFFKIATDQRSGKQGDLEMEDIVMNLWVPDGSLVATPFNWYIAAGSKLNMAIQQTLNAFINGTNLTVTYMPNGNVGNTPVDALQALAFPTTATLASSVEGLNEFTFSYQTTGGVLQL